MVSVFKQIKLSSVTTVDILARCADSSIDTRLHLFVWHNELMAAIEGVVIRQEDGDYGAQSSRRSDHKHDDDLVFDGFDGFDAG